MILKQGHTYRAMPHDGKVIRRIYRGGRCYYEDSPYSLAATQALKAAFPQYWTAIRDYGVAHPQLVPFINEDPMLIVSLVEVGKVRGLLFDGNTYTDTGIVGNTVTNMSMKMYWTEVENGYHINGSADNMQIGANADKWHNFNTSSTAFQVGKYAEIVAEVKDGKWNTYVDGQQILSFATPSRGTTYTHTIGCWNGSQGKLYWCKQVVAEAIVNDHRFLPFTRNGENGMLDILSGTFYPNANTQGTFTIQLTDKAT